MFKIFCVLVSLLFVNISQGQGVKTVRGGLHIGDYSVSIGHREYHKQLNQLPVEIWVSNPSDARGYVNMTHMQPYEIRLASSFYGNSDAKIEIDGKEIGVFRIKSNSVIVIERNVKDRGRLTFVRNGTREYFDSGLDKVLSHNRGLVKVTFYPERLRNRIVRNYYDAPHKTTEDEGKITSFGVRSGGTALTGSSDQDFIDVNNIERDYSKSITINLRLVEEARYQASSDDSVRPLEDVRNYGREVTPKNNPIPPPVER